MLDAQTVLRILNRYTCLNASAVTKIQDALNQQLELQQEAKSIQVGKLRLEVRHRADYDIWNERQTRLQDNCPHLSQADGYCNLCGAKV